MTLSVQVRATMHNNVFIHNSAPVSKCKAIWIASSTLSCNSSFFIASREPSFLCAETCSIADTASDARARFDAACLSSPSRPDSGLRHTIAILIGVLVTLFVFGVIAFCFWRRRKQRQAASFESTHLLNVNEPNANENASERVKVSSERTPRRQR